MPSILWSLYFIQAQGYDMTHVLVYQDNKSVILLETIGKTSSSKRTKHIKMWYFFMKDKVESGDIKLEYKLTEDMWIDVNTKLKQGQAFQIDCSHIMNCPINIPDETLPHSNLVKQELPSAILLP